MDMRHFALQQWVEQDLIVLKHIPTGDNSSDSLTKSTPRVLFTRHNDFILRRIIPQYSILNNTVTATSVQNDVALDTGS